MTFGFGMGFPRNETFAGGPSLNLQFAGSQVLPSALSFSRLSNATYFDNTGNLQSAANNVARFDYNPVTLAAQGLLIEEQRTNSIRNNTMVGAIAGTPGTLPTNWTVSNLGTLTQQIVGAGTSKGISYIDVRFNGTTSTTSLSINFEAVNSTAVVNGQTWSWSSYVALVSGSLTNITNIGGSINLFNASSVYLSDIATANFSPSAQFIRYSGSATITTNTAAFARSLVYLLFNSGVAIDITLRIGLPQLENNAISTGVSSATVAAGGTGYTNGDTLTVVGGTGTAATLTVTGVSAGVITTVSVATAGSYSVFPTSPASVTGGTGSAATFNLVPVTQSGFATSVILTSTAAATRSADNCSTTTLSPWFNATEGTMAIKYRTGADLITTRAAVFDDGGFSNTISIIGSDSGGVGPRFDVFVAGVNQASVPSGNINAANTVFTFSAAYKANDFAASRNGSAASTDTSGTVPTVTTLRIGQQLNSGYLNGWVQSFSYYPRRVSNTELQALTT